MTSRDKVTDAVATVQPGVERVATDPDGNPTSVFVQVPRDAATEPALPVEPTVQVETQPEPAVDPPAVLDVPLPAVDEPEAEQEATT